MDADRCRPPHADIAFPLRMGKHEIGAVTEYPRRIEDLNRPPAQRDSVLALRLQSAGPQRIYTWPFAAISVKLAVLTTDDDIVRPVAQRVSHQVTDRHAAATEAPVHMSALPYDEVPAALQTIRDTPSTWPAAPARLLKFPRLDSSRSREVRFATWSEIDTTVSTWFIVRDWAAEQTPRGG